MPAPVIIVTGAVKLSRPRTSAGPGQISACRRPNQTGLRDAKERAMATLMQDSAHAQRAMSSRVEAVGRELARYGLVVVVAWIGLMKFTGYEAEGIRL